MARTATRFAGPAVVGSTAATKYTVPASSKAVIRHVHISNPSASAVDFTMSIGTDATGTRIYSGYSISADTVYDHYPYYVVDAAEIIQAFAGTENILTLTIDGDLLTVG